MEGDDDCIRGRGYLYQGAWLGTDPAAFNEVKLDKADVSGVEVVRQLGRPPYNRVVTKTGHVWIIFEVYASPPPSKRLSRVAPPDPPKLKPPPQRVLILPPPKKDPPHE